MLGSAARQAERVSYPQPTPLTSAVEQEERHAEVVPLPIRTVGGQPTSQPISQPASHVSNASSARTIELNLLGGFRLVIGGQLVHVGKTGERLLAVVACRGRQATRSQIAHTLWPDTTSGRAHANLRTTLYRLYRRAPGAIHATSTYLQLPVGMQIDLEQTTRLANRVLGGTHGAHTGSHTGSHTGAHAGAHFGAHASDPASDQALLVDALHANLYDDLLPDWDDEWLGDTQYRYRQLRLAALEQLSARLASAGHYGGAVQAALAAVQADPLRDSAHEILIRACLAQGNRHEALVHYTKYRRILRDELGLDPPAAIGKLLTSA
jgi:DNA-binding SARP family transcriptional activator